MKFNPDERYFNILEFEKALTSRVTYGIRKMSRFALAMSTIVLLLITGNLIAFGYSLFEAEKLNSDDLKGYESIETVNLAKISYINSGINVEAHASKEQHKIVASRELLPEIAQEFIFMSVFKIDESFEIQTIQDTIYGVASLGFGLNFYFDELSYIIKLEDSRYFVLLFDENIHCVGYHIIKKMEGTD